MKIGISALLFNIEEALEICKEIKEIRHIEIGIDNINECIELNKYKKYIEELDISIGIHLPMELNTCENIQYIRNSWLNFVEEINLNLEAFNVKYFNLHLGYVMSNRLSKDRKKYLDISKNFFNELEIGIDITIENTYSKKGDFSNIGNLASDFEYIFNENEKLYFCYDTGHNLINSDNYIDKLKNRIKVIHLSDNDGIDDLHVGIGNGKLVDKDIKKVLNLDADYLILEIKSEHIKDSLNKIGQIIKEV